MDDADLRVAGENHGFPAIQSRACCPFAARSRVEAAPAFDGDDAYMAGQAAAPHLVRFARRVDSDSLDGFVIELTCSGHGVSVDALAAVTRAVLAGLLTACGDSDAEGLNAVTEEDWWFAACGTRWFVLVFAPCYGPASPRHTFGSRSTFMVLQPVASFDRHATPKGAEISTSVRELIRQAYSDAGRPYDAGLAAQGVESLKFVWPLEPGDEPIRWWVRDAPAGGGAS